MWHFFFYFSRETTPHVRHKSLSVANLSLFDIGQQSLRDCSLKFLKFGEIYAVFGTPCPTS